MDDATECVMGDATDGATGNTEGNKCPGGLGRGCLSLERGNRPCDCACKGQCTILCNG